MNEDVMRKHINLYVNEHSLSLGEKGKTAVNKLFEMAVELKIISEPKESIFALREL